MTSGSRYPGTVGLVGLGLAALAGVLAALAAAYDWAEGPARFDIGTAVVSYPTGVAAVGILGAVLVTLCIAAPWTWARITGVALTAGSGTIYSLLVIAARSSTDLEVDADVELLTGAQLASVAYLACVAGVALALIGGRAAPEGAVRSPSPPPPPLPPTGYGPPAGDRPPDAGDRSGYGVLPQLEAPPPAPARGGTSGKAIASLVLGIIGLVSVVAPPLSALAVVFASLARTDIRRSGRRLGGGGMATAGLVLGVVGLALSVLILTAVMFTLPPDTAGVFEFEE